MNKEPSQIAVETAQAFLDNSHVTISRVTFDRLCDSHQIAIDKATEGMVSIEDVKPLIDRLASDIGYSHCGELCAFIAKYGDKLK